MIERFDSSIFSKERKKKKEIKPKEQKERLSEKYKGKSSIITKVNEEGITYTKPEIKLEKPTKSSIIKRIKSQEPIDYLTIRSKEWKEKNLFDKLKSLPQRIKDKEEIKRKRKERKNIKAGMTNLFQETKQEETTYTRPKIDEDNSSITKTEETEKQPTQYTKTSTDRTSFLSEEYEKGRGAEIYNFYKSKNKSHEEADKLAHHLKREEINLFKKSPERWLKEQANHPNNKTYKEFIKEGKPVITQKIPSPLLNKTKAEEIKKTSANEITKTPGLFSYTETDKMKRKRLQHASSQGEALGQIFSYYTGAGKQIAKREIPKIIKKTEKMINTTKTKTNKPEKKKQSNVMNWFAKMRNNT